METLLVIDDNLIAQFIIDRYLKQTALFDKATYYQDAEAAINYLIDNRENPEQLPDVIFIETRLLSLSGWDFLNALKLFYSTLAKKCLIFIVTTIVSTDTRVRAASYPFITGIYQKPVTKDFFIQVGKDIETARTEG